MRARPALAGAGRGRVVEVFGDPVGVDDRDQPVDQDREVDHEDGVEDAGSTRKPSSAMRSTRRTIPALSASSRIGPAAKARARIGAPA